MFKVDEEKVSKILGISLEGLRELLKRQKGFLVKRKIISSKNLLESYQILAEIKGREEKEEARKIATVIKNPLLAKYVKKIEDLYMAGYGATRISKALFIDHRVKISKNMIERHLKSLNIHRSS